MVKLPGKRFEGELIRGWLHEPTSPPVTGIVPDALAITHGAGSNCEAPLLVAIAESFAAAGFYVLRFDLPYRQQGKTTPPLPAHQGKDREGIRRATEALREAALREVGAGSRPRIFLGGHSYGGRQATMAAAEDPRIADALLLLSYPLHPPRKPQELRTAHFPKLETPALFVHGTRDPFGSIEEMRAALAAIPAHHELVEVPGAPHGLSPKIAAWLPVQLAEFAR
jgi:predicted alpha/beta-hydrolase family hydrolase